MQAYSNPIEETEPFAGGLELNFFPEQQTSFDPNSDDPISIAKHALSVLMMGWPKKGTWGNLVSARALRAVFINRDTELLKYARLFFQEGLIHVFEQIQNKSFTEQEHRQIEFYLSNCLCFFPFFDPNPYESLKIPEYFNNQWTLVEYKITAIELTPINRFEQYFMQKNDRVFAYGLEPLSHLNARPHLIFMGTTYPQGQGLRTQLRTDMNSFRTVGEMLYKSGRSSLLKWMDEQLNPPHVCGVSLGGSMSLLLAVDMGDRLSRVDALNPAGLYKKHSKEDRWDNLTIKPSVFIQRQEKDPVSRLGYWKKDWHLLQIIAPENRKANSRFADHGLNYAGFKGTRFFSVDPEKDNQTRQSRNFFVYGLSRNIFYYAVILPYFYIIRPTHVLLKQQRLLWLSIFITLFALTPLPPRTMLTPLLMTSGVIFFHEIYRFFTNKKQKK